MKYPLFFGLIIVALTSCEQVNIDKEIAQIDSLTNVIKNSEIKLDALDIEKVKKLQEQMDNQIMLVKSIYGDSIEWENAKMLTKYYRASKDFKKYMNKHVLVKAELTYSYRQLSQLKADLTNNIIKTDSFHIYFENECTAAQELDAIIQKEISKAKQGFETYKDNLDKVEDMLKEQNTENPV